ncbi:flagellar hook capping FlgD N-terminal domain-containing protein [Curtobacterium sp. MCBD17_040]|uniref:flagellar hook assembly protein FlgD n=1 Tax=Curtobacterium sp. MCBD17_040 TaxID=2175674 RepID=UPI0015E8A040|nr:flagellar hook capping FlgD N-terminal domain-containing protein [Curtobacterium sp. MCBD17_040]WIB65582.1 flagellar hook capping FlgD N-terminal domain-containing protein [Curtobacterium sp. MCBD17_040]
MTDISPVAASSPSSGTSLYESAPTRAPKQTLDTSSMMDLLVTQLQNQDPSSPMDTNSMISQTTQLAEMQQLTSMGSDSTASLALQMRDNAANLVGKSVTYINADGSTGSGVVKGVTYTSTGDPTVTVNGSPIDIASISGVAPASATTAS